MKGILLTLSIAVIFITAFTTKPTNHGLVKEKTAAMMTTPPAAKTTEAQRNKIIARRFYDDVVNKHNIEMIDSYASADYIEHQYDTHFASDRKGLRKAFEHYFKAFPDMQVKANFMMAEGNLVTTQITTTGTNTGPLYGRPGTGKKIEINGVDIVRFKNGKVVEHWGYAEEGKMLSQLGMLMPMLKEARKEEQK